jgi:hypothetical protein
VKSRLSIISAAGFLDLLEVYTEGHQTHSAIARRSMSGAVMRGFDFATSFRPRRASKRRVTAFEPAGPVSTWTAFVAGLWSPRRMRAAAVLQRNARARAVLAFLLVLLPACAQLAQPSEAPPSSQPPYASLASNYLASVMADRASYEDFEISGLRWVHSFKGWSWLACVHFTDHGHVRTYALFIQNDTVVDGRYAVETDACASQTYTPFDVVTGTLGRPTAPRQPPLY